MVKDDSFITYGEFSLAHREVVLAPLHDLSALRVVELPELAATRCLRLKLALGFSERVATYHLRTLARQAQELHLLCRHPCNHTFSLTRNIVITCKINKVTL